MRICWQLEMEKVARTQIKPLLIGPPRPGSEQPIEISWGTNSNNKSTYIQEQDNDQSEVTCLLTPIERPKSLTPTPNPKLETNHLLLAPGRKQKRVKFEQSLPQCSPNSQPKLKRIHEQIAVRNTAFNFRPIGQTTML